MKMKFTQPIKRALVALVAAAVAALAAPAFASAGTVSISSGVLHYSGGSTEANHVTLSYDWFHGLYVVKDTGATIPAPAGTPCSSYDAHTVYCPWGSFGSLSVQLGGGGSYAADQLGLTAVTITGGTGNDTMIGGGGATTLVASGGNDTLTAGSGDTHFVGGAGSAIMNGGPGHDSFQGGSGSETINSRDGLAEQVGCGAGTDSVNADTSDIVAADCEKVDRGTPQPADTTSTPTGASGSGDSSPLPAVLPGAPDGFQPPTASVAIAAPVAVTAAGQVPVPVDCPANAVTGCEGTIVLTLDAGAAKARVVAARRERGRVVGKSKRFKIAAGHKAVVPVQLSRRGARILNTRGGHNRKVLKLTATVATRTEAGVRTSTHAITVTAARRRPTPVHRPKQRRSS